MGIGIWNWISARTTSTITSTTIMIPTVLDKYVYRLRL